MTTNIYVIICAIIAAIIAIFVVDANEIHISVPALQTTKTFLSQRDARAYVAHLARMYTACTHTHTQIETSRYGVIVNDTTFIAITGKNARNFLKRMGNV